jgi:Arc/MetJ-type ribon-helix-helix transcriptional regulator
MSIIINDPDLERLVGESVARGDFESSNELVSYALRLLLHEPDEEVDETRAAVLQGYEQAQRGEVRPAAEVFSELRRRHGLPD